jgi:hypothetical protein
MRRLRTIPLASGLLGPNQGSTYGQLEVSLTDYKIVHILIKRRPYTGQSDVKFSIPFSSLRELIELLTDAQERLDVYWLSMITKRPPEDEIVT